MRKIFLACLCCLVLVGCQKNQIFDYKELTDEEINIKYQEMKDKLIEYGKLIYENEQWLNDNSKIVTTYMTLKDLSKKNE